MSKLKEILKEGIDSNRLLIGEWFARVPNFGISREAAMEELEEEILKHYIPISEGPEVTAKLFHDTYERLAPDFGYETREDTKEFDPESPNGKLMTAVVGEIMQGYLPISEVEEIKELPDRVRTIRQLDWEVPENVVFEKRGRYYENITPVYIGINNLVNPKFRLSNNIKITDYNMKYWWKEGHLEQYKTTQKGKE